MADLYHDPKYQRCLLEHGTRDQIIRWLAWNDPNGSYTDTHTDLEGLPPVDLETAREIMTSQLS